MKAAYGSESAFFSAAFAAALQRPWPEAGLPEFLKLRRERWQIHRAGPWSDAAIEARIDGAIAVLEPAIERNFERWPLLGEVIWPNDLGAEDRTTYVDEVSYLKSWIKQRMGWMDLVLSP